MAYTPYYAPYYRPMNYYNPSVPQENPNLQNVQQYGQPMQPQMQPPSAQMPMAQAAPMTPNDMIWVLSEVEAQSYPVAPNNSVILWDKNNDVIYIKSANMQGVPSMRILDYTERTENASYSSHKRESDFAGKYVPLEDFAALRGEFETLRSDLEDFKAKSKGKPIKKVLEEGEDNG